MKMQCIEYKLNGLNEKHPLCCVIEASIIDYKINLYEIKCCPIKKIYKRKMKVAKM